MSSSNAIKVYFVLNHTDAKLPTRTKGDIGFDLYASADQDIKPGHNLVDIGISFTGTNCIHNKSPMSSHVDEMFNSFFFKIEGRSGLAANYGIFPIAGIIDPDYMGPVKVVLVNVGKDTYTVHKGDRVAQLVIYKTITDDAFNDVVIARHVPSGEDTRITNRGFKGFGSSGA